MHLSARAIVNLTILGIAGLVALGGLLSRACHAVSDDSRIAVFADVATTVEILDGDAVIETRTVPARQHALIGIGRGDRTIRSRPAGGQPYEVKVGSRLATTWVVPTSPEQCFVVADFSVLYNIGSKAILQRRIVDHAPFELDRGMHLSVVELPAVIHRKDRDVDVVTPLPCAKLKTLSDADAIAAVTAVADHEQGVVAAQAAKDLAPAMADLDERLRSEWHDLVVKEVARRFPTWSLAYDGREALVWTTGPGELLALAVERMNAARPRSRGTLYFDAAAAFVKSLGADQLPGVFRSSDVLPSIDVAADGPAGLTLATDVRAGLVFARASEHPLRISAGLATAAGIDLEAMARRNAEAEFADDAAACVASARSGPAHCGRNAADATGLLVALVHRRAAAKLWAIVDQDGLSLEVPKPHQHVPTPDGGTAFTLDAKGLHAGLH